MVRSLATGPKLWRMGTSMRANGARILNMGSVCLLYRPVTFTLAIFRTERSMAKVARSSSAVIFTPASGKMAKEQGKAATSLQMVECTKDRCGIVSLMDLGS